MTDLFFFHVDHPETFDTGRINDVPANGKWMHLRKGGGVLSLSVAMAHFTRSQVQFRFNSIHQGALSDTTMSAEQGGLSLQYIF